MSKFLASVGLVDRKPQITTTVSDLAPSILKVGFFSKRGPKRNSKYNLRYWILTETHLYYFATAAGTEHALGLIELRTCKLNTDGCAPVEFILLSATSEKSREYYLKTDTAEARTAWGGAIQSCINKLIAGKATFSGTPAFSPISPRGSGNDSTAYPPSGSSGTGTTSTEIVVTPSDSVTSAQSGARLSTSGWGIAGPVSKFNPAGASEIIRVYLPDTSCKTLMFDTTQTIDVLAQQMTKKMGPGYENYIIFAYADNELQLLPLQARLVDIVTYWPSKNDPERYRLMFQPREEVDRLRAATVGFIHIQTDANAHSYRSSGSFVSSVMVAIKNKPEWTGNTTLAQLPTPYLFRGVVNKKGKTIVKDKTVTIIVTAVGLYFFVGVNIGPLDKSKGWIPLEKSALFKEKGPTGFIIYYIFPGTMDLNRHFEAQCATEAEKESLMNILSPLCKGAVPAKGAGKPRGRSAAAPAPQPGSAPSSAPPSPTPSPHPSASPRGSSTSGSTNTTTSAPTNSSPSNSVSSTNSNSSPSNSVSTPAITESGEPSATSDAPTADVGSMLESTPSEGPKLVHLTAGRPKGAAKRPPTRPAAAARPASGANPVPSSSTPAITTSSSLHSSGSQERSTYEGGTISSSGASDSAASDSNLRSSNNSVGGTTPRGPNPPTGGLLLPSPSGHPLYSPRSSGDLSSQSGSGSQSPRASPSPRPGQQGTTQSGGATSTTSSSNQPNAYPASGAPMQQSQSSPNMANRQGIQDSGARPPQTSGTPPAGSNPGANKGPGVAQSNSNPAFGRPPPPGQGSANATSRPIQTNLATTGATSNQSNPGARSNTPTGTTPPTSQSPGASSSGSQPIQTSSIGNTSSTSANNPAIASSPSQRPGQVLAGPNPNQFAPMGQPQRSGNNTGLGNPALNTSSDGEPEVLDIAMILGMPSSNASSSPSSSSPALPQQTFPIYQSPHVTSAQPGPYMTSSTNISTMYSPVLAKPIAVQQSPSPAPEQAQSPTTSSAPHLVPTNTITIAPLPSDVQHAQQQPDNAHVTIEAPVPVLEDIFASGDPMTDTFSPFDAI